MEELSIYNICKPRIEPSKEIRQLDQEIRKAETEWLRMSLAIQRCSADLDFLKEARMSEIAKRAING